MIRLLHVDMNASVMIDGESSNKFKVRTGVKQGCVLAPTLFSIFLVAVLHIVEKHAPTGIDIKYRIYGGLFNLHRLKAKTLTSMGRITELQYADDNAIVAHSEEDLQKAVDAFQHAYSSLGLRLNVKKTQILYQPNPDKPKHSIWQPSISVDGELLDNVEHFSYLGSTLSSNANINKEIEKRLHAASAAYGRLRVSVYGNRDL